jgi:polygalacturonase
VNCQLSGFEEGTLLDGTMKLHEKRGTGRIKFGTETSGGFRNIAIANCTFRSCFGLTLQMVDGGIFENVTINNLVMTDVKHYAIHLTTGKRNRTPDPKATSRMRNVLISNIVADNIDNPCAIQLFGLPEQPLENIRLENIRITTRGGGQKADATKVPGELGDGGPEPSRWKLSSWGIFARHVKGLELANITLNFQTNDFRPVAQFVDIDGLELDNFKARRVDDVPVADFAADVRGVRITDSPGIEPPK